MEREQWQIAGKLLAENQRQATQTSDVLKTSLVYLYLHTYLTAALICNQYYLQRLNKPLNVGLVKPPSQFFLSC